MALTLSQWGQIIGGDASETGSGAGSYDIRQSVWHVNVSSSLLDHLNAWVRQVADQIQCCNPEIGGGGGWGIFNALLGWQNSATYGSVIAYNLYWVVVIMAFLAMRYNERQGHWPLMKAKTTSTEEANNSSSDEEAAIGSTEKASEGGHVVTKVRSLGSPTPS